MSKSLNISEELYAVIESHRRDDEEVEATLRRLLVGAPSGMWRRGKSCGSGSIKYIKLIKEFVLHFVKS